MTIPTFRFDHMMMHHIPDEYRGGRICTAAECEEIDRMAKRTHRLDDAAGRVERYTDRHGHTGRRVALREGEARIVRHGLGHCSVTLRRGAQAVAITLDPHALWAVAEMCARMAEAAEQELRDNRARCATQVEPTQ